MSLLSRPCATVLSFSLAIGMASCATQDDPGAEADDFGPDADADSDGDADGDCDPADHETPFPQPGWTEEGPAYADCPYADELFGNCVDVECADSPEAEELIRRFREAVAEAGYEDRVEVIEASYDPDLNDGEGGAALPFFFVSAVAVVDWSRCPLGYSQKGIAELPSVAELRDALPDLPDALPSYADVLAEIRRCDPQGEPALCRNSCTYVEGTAGGCGQVTLRWDSDVPAGFTTECNFSSGEDCCVSGG